MKLQHIAVIGVGNMGGAMVSGWVEQKALTWEQLHLFDAHKNCKQIYPQANSYDNLEDCIKGVDWLFLCVKPCDVAKILAIIKKNYRQKKHPRLVSIAAGLGLKHLIQTLGKGFEVVRAMPNAPLLVGEGAVALSFSPNCSAPTREFLTDIFSVVGQVVAVEEKLMDIVTGLSGSGPAFIYILIEAMADAGVAGGLARDQALKLAAQTVYGGAKMVLATGENPCVLKDKVTSADGTTIAGIMALEKSGFRTSIQAGIAAATKKSQSMNK